MRITINEDSQVEDIHIAITCPKVNEQVTRILESINAWGAKLSGVYEGEVYVLKSEDVFYIESVEGKTFFYTAEKVLETPLRLFEMEERLANTEFVRVSKQMIVNFDKVQAIKPCINMRLQLILNNGEAVIVSRQYASVIKEKIRM